MSTLATILAATEAAEETSKAPFYIAGLVLAAWAVLVGVVGISRPAQIPATAITARLTILISVVLVGAAMATAVLTS